MILYQKNPRESMIKLTQTKEFGKLVGYKHKKQYPSFTQMIDNWKT